MDQFEEVTEKTILIQVPEKSDLKDMEKSQLLELNQLYRKGASITNEVWHELDCEERVSVDREEQLKLLEEFRVKYPYKIGWKNGKTVVEKVNYDDVEKNIRDFDYKNREGWQLGYDENGEPFYGVSYYGGGAATILVSSLAEAKKSKEREKRREERRKRQKERKS